MPEHVSPPAPKSPVIEPRTPKGFRDSLPARAVAQEALVNTAATVLRRHGFLPIRTPAVEFEEVLTGKGGSESDRQMYRFADPSGRRLGLRFDLTVPLARFVSQHRFELALPASLYQWGPVWRGENTQRGRSREFVQFDFDTLGVDSAVADAGIIAAVFDILTGFGVPRFRIAINSRQLLARLVTSVGLPEGAVTPALRSLDKLAKLGANVVASELAGVGASAGQAATLLELASLSGPAEQVLGTLVERGLAEAAEQAGARLVEVAALAEAAGVAKGVAVVDLSIARGLDYYTGMVFETTLVDLPGIGSVCSGGRYDTLTSLFSPDEPLAGVGGSVGVDRLLDALEEMGLASASGRQRRVLIAVLEGVDPVTYEGLAAKLRAVGLAASVYPGPARLARQMRHADRAGFDAVVLVGPEELAAGQAQLKRLKDASSSAAPLPELAEAVAALLGC